MVLYHGSIVVVEAPEIRKGDVFLDFGFGFYLTTSYEQAERWAKIKMHRAKADAGYVSVYQFDLEQAEKELVIRQFGQANAEWLEFVVNNRKGIADSEDVDIHVGPVADDNVYQTIRLFETGAYDAEYAIRRLKTEVLHDQWTLHTERAIALCKFTDFKEIR